MSWHDHTADNSSDNKTDATAEGGKGGFDKFTVGKAMEDEPEMKQPEHAGIIPKLPFRMGLIGPSKSGKTNLGRWLLDKFYMDPKNPKKSFFKKIHLLSPTAHIDYTWTDLPGLDKKDRHANPTGETIQKILNDAKKKILGSLSDSLPQMSKKELKRRKEKADQFLVIADDAIAESSLINSSEFLKMFYQIRHYGGNIMVMAQSYKKLPRAARLQLSHLGIFQPMLSEIEKIGEDHGTKALNKKEWIQHVQEITKTSPGEPGGDYPFMYIESFAPLDRRYRRNLDTPFPISEDRLPGQDGETSGAPQSREEVDSMLDDQGQFKDPSNEDKTFRGKKRKAVGGSDGPAKPPKQRKTVKPLKRKQY